MMPAEEAKRTSATVAVTIIIARSTITTTTTSRIIFPCNKKREEKAVGNENNITPVAMSSPPFKDLPVHLLCPWRVRAKDVLP